MFHWGLILHYSVYVVLPLVFGFWLVDWLTGGVTLDNAIHGLTILLPFIAISWLAYQNFKPRKK